MIELPTDRAFVDIDVAAEFVGSARSTVYRLAKDHPDQLPFRVIRVGRRMRVPVVDLVRLAGFEEAS